MILSQKEPLIWSTKLWMTWHSTSALWPTERANGIKVVGVYEVDFLIAILVQLASLEQKMERMSKIQIVESK